MDFAPVTFRLSYGRPLAVVTVVIAASGIVGLLAAGDLASFGRLVWPLLFVAVTAWALFWRPELRVEEHRIVVKNVFRTFELPWPALQRVDTKYALTLFTTIGTIPVWSAPAPGRYASSTATLGSVGHVPRTMLGVGGSIRPGDLPASESGAPAYVIRQRYDELLETGMLEGGVEPGSARVTPNLAVILMMVGLALATTIGFAFA